MWFQRSYLQKRELSSNYLKSLMAPQLNQMANSLPGTSRKSRGDLWGCCSWTCEIAVSLLKEQASHGVLHFMNHALKQTQRVCLVVHFWYGLQLSVLFRPDLMSNLPCTFEACCCWQHVSTLRTVWNQTLLDTWSILEHTNPSYVAEMPPPPLTGQSHTSISISWHATRLK